MRLVILDFEVYAHDFLAGFKDVESQRYTQIWNDNDAIANCLMDDVIYVTFNGKHYDNYIFKAICAGFTSEEVKEVNDFIIVKRHEGWEHPVLKQYSFYANVVDVKDDMQKGQSLKSIEGHLGMNIKETDVDFNLNRRLTEAEKQMVSEYNRHDLDATEKIFKLRKDYYKNKVAIGKLAGIDEVKAMSMTNAKLTAAMLKASPKQHDDERQYKYRNNLKREYIPQEVFDYFNRMYDSNLSDDEVFKGDKLKLNIGACAIVMGYGGIHGAIPNLIWREEGGGD